ncbi:MAG: S-methyl-5-thioribose-1-phosphate isomerase [Bacillota bacterium]|nr:S-methyl-5-thioribose-1-phosphate isomerase [Bacillota bacterium]
MRVKTLEWRDGTLYLLDQRKLPAVVETVACRTVEEVARAIETMVVRGAPAIGAAAAFGVALGARAGLKDDVQRAVTEACQRLGQTRPTAVNLFWALRRMQARASELACRPPSEVAAALEAEAEAIYREDIAQNRRIGEFGAALVPPRAGLLTHCNAGALATVDYGTALAVVRVAREQGKEVHVYADETRPFLQGARLTAWELLEDGIPVTLITDNMAAYAMAKGLVNLVVVGADRVAANGDVANKIGTYGVAILAREHGIPFYVAAPWSTVDLSIPDGAAIPIEERSPEEVTHVFGQRVAPEGVAVLNPAFDVTPHSYIAGIITEHGVLRPPFDRALAEVGRRE